jgi:ABC-2 type transport system ATP-binding protein
VSDPLVRAARLTRRFGARIAVEDVSLDLVAGEIFALLGPNGAGKTTTLRILAGLIAPSSGTVTIGGQALLPASAPRLRSRIGFLTEAPGLWDRLTVRQNLTVYARLHGLADPRRAVDGALATFGIGDREHEAAAQLSKGLRQRVALARTLLHDPDVILLDEPTSGLDPESARDVRELILRLRAERRAVVLSTHNLDEVERVADRVAVLRSRLVALDTPAALRARLFGNRVRITLAREAERFASSLRAAGIAASVDGTALSIAQNTSHSPVTVPALVRQLVDQGADIEEVVTETPPLEEVYLKLLAQGDSRR